ncbi:ATPase involved in DNA repair [Cedecea neteri]|uniref:ATPase involved in DNA repair n=1 Tax=Cedecea neteri TaxID=158822 RepID=A0A291E6E1_9ENTR|nr:DUF3732 domain-containing protein [Cedecea neteri]ATF95503.1 DUF3732 domain-containing protein [Cedecea neteri]SQC92060.1 ATPase involved in DNA repair [Cedecea neteri]
MTCFVKYIGVADTRNKIHKVSLKPGLNVITGKSSTGKSALLEIFDYCMGSSEDTIPIGIITERAETFFIALQFTRYAVIAARKKKSDRCFLIDVPGVDPDHLSALIEDPAALFGSEQDMPLSAFKKSLGRHFGVIMGNVDETPFKLSSGRHKSPTPTVRSFSSFMLQHQNLIANKHAIFYRFDEKEKRDQAIKHFKILMGLVNEDYFDLHKEFELAKFELGRVQRQIPQQAQRKALLTDRYNRYLKEYLSLTGKPLIDGQGEAIYAHPAMWLEQISRSTVSVNVLSDQIEVQRDKLEKERAEVLGKKRKVQGQLRLIKDSRASAMQFTQGMSKSHLPDSATLSHAYCPMCKAENSLPVVEVNKLTEAITWLNDELAFSTYARESFEGERRKLEEELDDLNDSLSLIQESIEPFDEEFHRLQAGGSINEQAIKAKIRLELAIQEQLDRPVTDLDELEAYWRAEIIRLSGHLEAFKVERSLHELSISINDKMCEYGDLFDFEETYKPSALRFDTETFDLWYQQDPKNRVYLRAMGSGANWLYSHLALFMALHYQFAAHSKRGCKIPPILFLDQPTQVYFPAALDDADEFRPKELARQNRRENILDDDMKAVTNMFIQLAKFCEKTGEETGVTPQVIVSDHADNLILGEGYHFQDYVRATWRSRGEGLITQDD